MSANPLIPEWGGPYGGVPPWDRMAPEHFPGAFEAAIAEQRREIDAIVANSQEPTFDNTIVAFDGTGRMLDRLERMFGVARESVTTPAYQALEHEWQPKLAAAADAILFNEGLFKRIQRVPFCAPRREAERRGQTAAVRNQPGTRDPFCGISRESSVGREHIDRRRRRQSRREHAIER